MRVEAAMSTPAVTVTAATPVKRAAELLAARGFTVLPVVDEELRLVGIVSEGDLVRDRFPAKARLAASGAAGAGAEPGATVGEVMTREVLTVTGRDDVHELVERMRRARVRAVPVCRDGMVTGVVTYRDLVRTVARRDERIASAVRVRLESCFTLGRFEVAVDAGAVLLSDRMDRPEDWHTARVLAEQVPGVARARVAARAESTAG
ncbi:CBS domain-containing protein [Pseudonocardia acaciae]|uniref:CBS domain-containing protein n=1 Tax=Pseudonocardia acaciae TaxID=551276 RepID=UPI00048E6590|nr:CBS domain-containing protein [Pseudonocardia acaciae]